jgi:hypothetical protein
MTVEGHHSVREREENGPKLATITISTSIITRKFNFCCALNYRSGFKQREFDVHSALHIPSRRFSEYYWQESHVLSLHDILSVLTNYESEVARVILPSSLEAEFFQASMAASVMGTITHLM